MNHRNLSLTAVLASALVGSACVSDGSINDPNGGLPPDTLPLSISDSTLSFSIETSALFSSESMQVFFTIRNNGTTPRAVQGSSSCALTVRAFTLSGTQVSPPASRACTTDLATFANLAPGEAITLTRSWSANSNGTAGSGATGLATGTYELEGFVDAVNFQRTSRRLKVQIVKK